MVDQFDTIGPPLGPVFRITKKKYDPFEPPSLTERLKHAIDRPASRGSRFDDPRFPFELPNAQPFSVLYFGTRPAGAYAETIAPLQLNLATIGQIEAEEYTTTLNLATRDKIIDRDWCAQRHMGSTHLDRSLIFFDCLSARNVQALRSIRKLAKVVLAAGLDDFDLSTIYTIKRTITQEISRYIYDRKERQGKPLIAGMRYMSCTTNEECWAVFYDRMVHSKAAVQDIDINDPELERVTGLFRVSMDKKDP